jgi:membrane-associated phospholipid phosphatase
MSANALIWLIIVLISAADAFTLFNQHMSLDWHGESHNLLLFIVFMLLSWLLEKWRQPQAACFTTALTQCLVFAHAGTILTYALTAASPYPLADAMFDHADKALGFDWLAWFRWVDHHALVHRLLILSYDSMLPQLFLLLVIFSYVEPRRVQELILAGMLALIVICPIIYALPSIGAYAPHGIAAGVGWENDIRDMRSHAVFLIKPKEGIVTFPSYHTVLAVLFIHMGRGKGWLFYILLLLNALMSVSVMNAGGHYLVDMLGGIAVALVGIAATRCWGPAQRAIAPSR